MGDQTRYAALNQAGERNAYMGVATFTRTRAPGQSWSDWHQRGGNGGGHTDCGHLHQSYEAAERCGRRIARRSGGDATWPPEWGES